MRNNSKIVTNGFDKRTNNNASHLKKPSAKKKQPITIYETGEDIAALGGLENVRRLIKAAFRDAKKDYDSFVHYHNL